MKNPLLPGTYYHIYNRGNNKEVLFKEERNYRHFLKLWNRHIAPIADTYAYSLLSNHFHFLVKVKPEEELEAIEKYQKKGLLHLSQTFANLFNAYAKAINKATGRTGSLFQENFRHKPAGTPDYCKTLVLYIHTNAEKHGLIRDFKMHPHSSYHSFLSKSPSRLKRAEVLEWFDGLEHFIVAHEEYRKTR